ncbi:hypothetical protein BC939DRAFT_306382 [Gamsiella multidivaricata]|uniref:uncharacterized protein n=1 Tax=Gamsiella multidivaricata TaxID=101098 RepID=UPI00221F0E09|nr:uncharacterized protein BC939DRAFT_306382 [Gamsiella multidivaricata]KAI7818073.1 hypothetical protein BC939DRAFT_306382 [Gamsiella multidivaricata]
MLLSSLPQQQQQPRQHTPTYIYHHHSHHSSQSESSSSSTSTSSSPSKYNKRALQQFRQEQLDSMSITVEEYEDVLNAEVWIEINKLRDYARHGISREVRGVRFFRPQSCLASLVFYHHLLHTLHTLNKQLQLGVRGLRVVLFVYPSKQPCYIHHMGNFLPTLIEVNSASSVPFHFTSFFLAFNGWSSHAWSYRSLCPPYIFHASLPMFVTLAWLWKDEWSFIFVFLVG